MSGLNQNLSLSIPYRAEASPQRARASPPTQTQRDAYAPLRRALSATSGYARRTAKCATKDWEPRLRRATQSARARARLTPATVRGQRRPTSFAGRGGIQRMQLTVNPFQAHLKRHRHTQSPSPQDESRDSPREQHRPPGLRGSDQGDLKIYRGRAYRLLVSAEPNSRALRRRAVGRRGSLSTAAQQAHAGPTARRNGIRMEGGREGGRDACAACTGKGQPRPAVAYAALISLGTLVFDGTRCKPAFVGSTLAAG